MLLLGECIRKAWEAMLEENKRMKDLRKRQAKLAGAFSFRRKPINWVERKYQWAVNHYGEILEGKQQRLKRDIKRRLEIELVRKHEFKGYDTIPRIYESGRVKVKPRYRYRLKLYWRRETVRVKGVGYRRVNVPYYQ